MSVAKMTSKGQVTIPADIRKRLKLKPGDSLDFQVEENGTARIYPFSRKVSEVFGILSRKGRQGLSTEEIDDKLKEMFQEGRI